MLQSDGGLVTQLTNLRCKPDSFRSCDNAMNSNNSHTSNKALKKREIICTCHKHGRFREQANHYLNIPIIIYFSKIYSSYYIAHGNTEQRGENNRYWTINKQYREGYGNTSEHQRCNINTQ